MFGINEVFWRTRSSEITLVSSKNTIQLRRLEFHTVQLWRVELELAAGERIHDVEQASRLFARELVVILDLKQGKRRFASIRDEHRAGCRSTLGLRQITGEIPR